MCFGGVVESWGAVHTFSSSCHGRRCNLVPNKKYSPSAACFHHKHRFLCSRCRSRLCRAIWNDSWVLSGFFKFGRKGCISPRKNKIIVNIPPLLAMDDAATPAHRVDLGRCCISSCKALFSEIDAGFCLKSGQIIWHEPYCSMLFVSL